MARIPARFGIALGLLSCVLILPACQSRQNAEKKSEEKGTSWSATPKINAEDEGTPPGGTKITGKVEPQSPLPETKSPPPKTVEQPQPQKPDKVEPPPPPPKTIPKVLLTEKLGATCLVKVGDAFPKGQLADLSGKTHDVGELYGKRLTVVFFWSNGKTDYTRSAMDVAIRDLQLDVLEKYQKERLNVVGVYVGGPPEDLKTQIEKSEVKFPVLLDPQETFFHQVAKQELPRVYLLDVAGNILWFDIDFTYISRQNLAEAIKAVLKGGEGK
jgi:peroxiredoxin